MTRVLTLTTFLVVLAAAPAQAATVRVHESPGKVRFEAPAGEVNVVTVEEQGSELLVTDKGPTPLTAGSGCTAVTADSATCPLGSVRDIKVETGDLDDTVTIKTSFGAKAYGGDGNDTLTGGPGRDEVDGDGGDDVIVGAGEVDEIDGGDGNDTIRVRDSARDVVTCGVGEDAGEADLEDELAADCEKVVKPLAPPTVADPVPPVVTTKPVEPELPADEPVAPQPEPGRTVAVTVKKGHVFVVRPGGQSTPIDPAKPLPTGSVLDTRQGTVTLTSAADMNGKTQTADFTGATFAVVQKAGARMVTELQLRGGDFASCGRTAATRTTARAAGKRRIRRLWGSGHGRFTTRGKNSSATVRGTIWSVEDRCDGTLTRVERGVVVVNDFLRKRTKVVRKGESYFAATKLPLRRR